SFRLGRLVRFRNRFSNDIGQVLNQGVDLFGRDDQRWRQAQGGLIGGVDDVPVVQGFGIDFWCQTALGQAHVLVCDRVGIEFDALPQAVGSNSFDDRQLMVLLFQIGAVGAHVVEAVV